MAVIEPEDGLRRGAEADGRHDAPGIIVHPLARSLKLADIPVHVFTAQRYVESGMVPIEEFALVKRLHNVDEPTELLIAIFGV
jgi:hypothetical protein